MDIVPGNVRLLNRAQRRVLLRSICAYRTVSELAVNTIAATPPADLLAKEREKTFVIRQAAITAATTGVEPKNVTLDKWQERWSSGETGGWTRRLIPDVRSWCNRRHGRTNFHLTQFLSGHGCFGQYLHRIRKVADPMCVDCQAPVDDAEHAFFMCDRWWRQRSDLERNIRRKFTPESAVRSMLESSTNWSAVDSYVNLVLAAREEEERERQRR
ncbi:unnamed protein product [Macrosiphum euphorbiae]|uniref:Reverse transcriptase n=1 Tax=Macrosiphum euphorbiae TaxID=13131 RepID=A0AAV0WEX8_9HEMI|nr:unnamed protein product [Macrosiphum euphorbiae]